MLKKENLKQIAVYGFLIWLIPFLFSFFIYPFRDSNRGLFESLMTLALTIVAVFFSTKFFKSKNATRKDGLLIGIIWLFISIAIDSIMFIWGPIKMPVFEYIQDIALTYIIIPVISVGYSDN